MGNGGKTYVITVYKKLEAGAYTFKDDVLTLTYTTGSGVPEDAETLVPAESKTSTEKLIFTKKKEN